jgi:signal transduction histidine kinase/DNA-binding response OmpR family regulator/ligand-binding sensor domain-containing protein
MLTRILSIASGLLTVICLQAQQFVPFPLPNQQKLPQSEVYRIFEDSEGYMWYGTRGSGLCRDNGFQVDLFRSDRDHPTLLRSNWVTYITENIAEQEIWFGTKQGCYILGKKDYQVRPLAGTVNHIHGIVQTTDGNMWVAANKQVKVFTSKGEPIDSFALSWKGKPMSVERMTLDSHGILWLMQWDGGVQMIDTHTRKLYTMNWEEPVGPTSLTEDTLNHQFFVGTWGRGVYRYDGKHAEPLTPELTTEMQRKVRTVHYDGWRQMLWVVTMAGLYAYTIRPDGELNPYPTTDWRLTPQQAIYPLFFDHRGFIWVPGATPLSFILRPTEGKWMKRVSLEELTRQTGVQIPIDAFQSDGDDCWIWSDRTQLILYNHKTEQFIKANGKPDLNTTRFGDVMTRSSKGGIWCATGSIIYHCTHEGAQIRLNQTTDVIETVASLCESPDGQLYIGTEDGLYRYHPTNGSLDTIAHDTRTIRNIVVSPQGQAFFISTSKGVCSLEEDGYRVLAPYQRFTSLAYDVNNRLWVANAFGDVWTVDSALHHVPVASSKQSHGVKQLMGDSLGHLWVMGDTYLIEYHPESNLRRLFHCNENPTQLDNYGGISLTDDGKIVVAGGGGIVFFEPKPINYSAEIFSPKVASYVIDGKKHLLSAKQQKIEVPSDAVSLKMELTHFNYLKAKDQQFAYRIEGISDQWIELPVGENAIELVNLRKGRYKLQLKVCDSYAHWSEPVEVLVIDRLPAWYETWWAYVCYLTIAIAILILSIRFYLQKSKHEAQMKMNEHLSELKLRFFTNVSHELRTPLSLIITPLESMIARMEKSETRPDTSQLKGILKHANHLLDLVNRLLDFRKLDMGEQRLHPEKGDILEFLRTCVSSFLPIATNKEITLSTDIPEGTFYTEFDSQALHHVIYNLLSNAIKYTDANGRVMVSASFTSSKKFRIAVTDTGCGIATDELPHIFDRYYQASNANDCSVSGSGIGLNMVRDIVNLMEGTIKAESKPGKGSTFTLEIPLTQLSDPDKIASSPVIPKLPSLLIADDNDDFRDFLVHELSSDYNILQARNGKEALRIAQTQYVDVILSDVMMPQMDGNELCRRLKQDESTSHIFILLLTAKTAEESVLESYEAGADFYLTKPFNMTLLRNRLQHLTQIQEQRIELLTRNESQEPQQEDDLRISPIDRKFMEKMKATMEKHVADTTFSVDTFCSEMAMSRMNFYRKMHALTGKTPAQFINDYRLNLADRLLREGELNVSEVANRTGFTTASYFSKCYKAKFGVAPKDVRSK